jgi:hypothetical protein
MKKKRAIAIVICAIIVVALVSICVLVMSLLPIKSETITNETVANFYSYQDVLEHLNAKYNTSIVQIYDTVDMNATKSKEELIAAYKEIEDFILTTKEPTDFFLERVSNPDDLVSVDVPISKASPESISSQFSSMDTETQESSEVSSSASDETSEQPPKIQTIHLEEGTTGPPFEEADITDEADIQYIFEALQNMEPANFYEQLVGGYAVMVTFTDSGGKSYKYLITATDRGAKEGFVLAYNTDVLENPANIEHYDKETKYYEWHNLQSDIWAVIQKYMDCPFEYVNGEFEKKPE